jgi:hypothetical protein
MRARKKSYTPQDGCGAGHPVIDSGRTIAAVAAGEGQVRRVIRTLDQPAADATPRMSPLPDGKMNSGVGKLRSSLASDAAVTTDIDTRLMMRNVAQPSEALLLRAWVEGDSPHGLRVRIIRILPSGETSTMSARTIETACDIVENWLSELLRTSTPPSQPPP